MTQWQIDEKAIGKRRALLILPFSLSLSLSL
jgi:hypothetical protein